MTQPIREKSLHQGFTLIEVLLAMALTAMLGVMAYQGLSSAITAMESQEKEVTRITDLQTAWRVIGTDLQQTINREITDEEEEIRETFIAGTDDKEYLMEFTRSGWANPLGQRRSELQRVRYVFENRQLWREHWLTLDRLKEPEPVRLLLLDNIENAKVEFFTAKKTNREGGEWLDEWPEKTGFGNSTKKIAGLPDGVEKNPASGVEETPSALPLAVRITLETDDWGSIERLFLLPDSDE